MLSGVPARLVNIAHYRRFNELENTSKPKGVRFRALGAAHIRAGRLVVGAIFSTIYRTLQV